MALKRSGSYALVPDWEQAPEGLRHDDVAGVAVDARDRVYLLTRRASQVVVYEADGAFVGTWGAGLLSPRPHGLTIAPDGTVYCVDEGHQVVVHLTTAGELLGTIGTRDTPSATGYDGRHLDSIERAGPPFNGPTNVAVAASGEIYVSDGYGNARVHRFSAAGELLHSWGEPGTRPGQFRLVHGIAVHADGTVFVADRENDRLQLFDPAGEFLAQWTDVRRPTNIAIDGQGLIHVSELPRDPRGAGRVSVLDRGGELVARWGDPDREAPGGFIAPHDLAVDSAGAVYVAEVTHSHMTLNGQTPIPGHTLQKFRFVA